MTVDHWGIDSELKKNLAIHDNRLIDYINKKLIDFEGENHQKVRFICAPLLDDKEIQQIIKKLLRALTKQ